MTDRELDEGCKLAAKYGVSAKVQVKAAGGVRDLDGLIKVRDPCGSRCGATATAAMLDAYRRRAAAEPNR